MPHPTPHSLTPSLPHSPSSCVVYIDADMVTAVAWAPDSQLVSCSDDKSLGRWTAEGAAAGARIGVDVFVAHVSWFPSVGKQVPLTPALTHSLTRLPLARLPLTLCVCIYVCMCVCVCVQAADMFAAACTDGTFRFFSRSGREEKKIKAHEGECICACV